jgi:hypothetical protein
MFEDDVTTWRTKSSPPLDETASQCDAAAMKPPVLRSVSVSATSSARSDRPLSVDSIQSTIHANPTDRRLRNADFLDSNNLMDFLRARPATAAVVTTATSAASEAATVSEEALADFDRSGSIRQRRRAARSSAAFELNVDGRERQSISGLKDLQPDQSIADADGAKNGAERKSWRETLRKVLSARDSSSSEPVRPHKGRSASADLDDSRPRSDVANGTETVRDHQLIADRVIAERLHAPSRSETAALEDNSASSARSSRAASTENVTDSRPYSGRQSMSVDDSKRWSSSSRDSDRTILDAVNAGGEVHSQYVPYTRNTSSDNSPGLNTVPRTGIRQPEIVANGTDGKSDLIDRVADRKRTSDGLVRCEENNRVHEAQPLGTTTSAKDRSPEPESASDTWRWGRVFDEDDNGSGGLRRSATLPQRWRVRGAPAGSVCDNIEESSFEDEPVAAAEHKTIRREASVQHTAVQGTGAFDSSGANHTIRSNRLPTSPSRTLPEIPKEAPQTEIVTKFSSIRDSYVGRGRKSTDGQHASSHISTDIESTSLGSRDEGFESSQDYASQSDRSSSCYRDSTASSCTSSDVPSSVNQRPGTPYDEVAEDHPTSSDHAGEEAETSGTLFARSFDSLVGHELVVSGEAVDVDVARKTVPGQNAHVITTTHYAEQQQQTKQATPKSKKTSVLADLTARLSRPKKSAMLLGTTPVRSEQRPSRPASETPFVRGSTTRATMPASVLSANKKRASEMLSHSIHGGTPTIRDLQAPEPPRRTTSIGVNSSDITNRLTRGLPTRRSEADRCITPTISSKSRARLDDSASSSRTAQRSLRDGASTPQPRMDPSSISRTQDKGQLRRLVDKTPQRGAQQVRDAPASFSIAAGPYAHRTQRLVSFNTPQQARGSRYYNV